MTSPSHKKPHVLIILDGWGYREEAQDNAIRQANTPTWDKLWNEQPKTLISASGLDVGLPTGQMGNSEVGHMSLGAGRIVHQSISRIDKDITEGGFFENSAYTTAIDKAVDTGKAVHILGLLSPGGVHSHEDHILAMVELATQRQAKNIYVHAFLDGRDTPPRSAQVSLEKLEEKLKTTGNGKIASIVGRYFAMDRDNRWDRVQLAFQLLTEAKAEFQAPDAVSGLLAAYAREENDEFVKPTTIKSDNDKAAFINDGDVVIFMNFRADRAREITHAFVDDSFDDFVRDRQPQLASFVTTTQYASNINTPCAYPPTELSNSFGELMEKNGKTQLRIAETEKYAHVTFFFSGGREALFNNEDRILIPSPDVATYDLQPEMSAPEVTKKLVAAIKSRKYDAIICNYANGDMIGHTGIFSAAIKAAETIDHALKKITEAIHEVGGECLITADHGNCEQMLDYKSGQQHTQHTTELVPFIYVGNREINMQQKTGKLADVAPTLLKLMGLDQPPEMSGKSLIEL